ncbi:hypothetical protein BDZ45DRAFT_732695 [Acephala macrosclerotiorum]|nr:hypothetical protein BDZ45DRAFT_732695 [Acephala macrosclerotiorum]
MCLGPANGSLYLDTGLMDSGDDSGVNSKRSDRDGRSYNYTATYYGLNNYMPSSLERFGNLTNATYVHSDYKQLALGYDANLDNSMYTVIPVVRYPESPMDEFAPIPELFSPNGSTTLVQDIVSHSSSGDQKTNFTVYAIDKPVSVLSCLEQHQLCNPDRPKGSATRCTPQIDLEALYNFNKSTLFDTDHQLTVANIIGLVIQDAGLFQIIPLLASPLLASSNLMTMESTPIASDQWVVEASNWFSTGVNLMQRGMVEVATGPSGQDAKYTANAVCTSDRSRGWTGRPNHYLQSLRENSWLDAKRWTRGIDCQTYCSLDSALQIQRMAFEEAGLGTWETCAEEIPVTAKGELIQVASEWDEWDPSIRGRDTVLKLSMHPEVVPEKGAVSSTVCEIPTPTSSSPTSIRLNEARTEIPEIRD